MSRPPVPSVTRIEIGTRPGFADSRGASVARQIREHLGIASGLGCVDQLDPGL